MDERTTVVEVIEHELRGFAGVTLRDRIDDAGLGHGAPYGLRVEFFKSIARMTSLPLLTSAAVPAALK